LYLKGSLIGYTARISSEGDTDILHYIFVKNFTIYFSIHHKYFQKYREQQTLGYIRQKKRRSLRDEVLERQRRVIYEFSVIYAFHELYESHVFERQLGQVRLQQVCNQFRHYDWPSLLQHVL
jgi:hypothetical protein